MVVKADIDDRTDNSGLRAGKGIRQIRTLDVDILFSATVRRVPVSLIYTTNRAPLFRRQTVWRPCVTYGRGGQGSALTLSEIQLRRLPDQMLGFLDPTTDRP